MPPSLNPFPDFPRDSASPLPIGGVPVTGEVPRALSSSKRIVLLAVCLIAVFNLLCLAVVQRGRSLPGYGASEGLRAYPLYGSSTWRQTTFSTDIVIAKFWPVLTDSLKISRASPRISSFGEGEKVWGDSLITGREPQMLQPPLYAGTVVSWMGEVRGGIREVAASIRLPQEAGSTGRPSVTSVNVAGVREAEYHGDTDRIDMVSPTHSLRAEQTVVHEYIHRLQAERGVRLGAWWAAVAPSLPQRGEYARTSVWEHQADAGGLAWMWRKACQAGLQSPQQVLLSLDDRVPGVREWARVWQLHPRAHDTPIRQGCVVYLQQDSPRVRDAAARVWGTALRSPSRLPLARFWNMSMSAPTQVAATGRRLAEMLE